MTIKERNIKILMKDYCTRKEAKYFLENNTKVFSREELKKNIEIYFNEWGVPVEERQSYFDMIENEKPVVFWSIVKYKNEIYYIQYINKHEQIIVK
jgi:hypothetical protein